MRRQIIGLVLVAGLVIAATYALTPIVALIFAPWSISQGGSPTLTGTWAGPLRSKWGSEYHLLLSLDWESPGGDPVARV